MNDENTAPASSNQVAAEALAELRTRWETAHGKALLPDRLAQLQRLDKAIAGLQEGLTAVRARGYRYGQGWEERVEALRKEWPAQRRAAQRLFDEQSKALQKEAQDIGQMLSLAGRSPKLFERVESSLTALEQQISGAEARLQQVVAASEESAADLETALEKATFLLDQLDEAEFRLYPEEEGVAACRAQWLKDKEGPEGVLFLTNQRILFEQKEEKATKKILFITTEKELVQETLWQAPVGAVVRLNAEDKGGFLGFGVKELLTLEFDDRARGIPHSITLRFKDYADNEGWQSLIRQVQSGQIEERRYQSPEAEDAPPPAPLPVKCPACGAKLPAIYKGMRQVECEFCHTTIPLA